ncbi:putative late blight resistance protein homolog R1B-16 [Bidens hawaiensis]|uniref:putative late blight resistance protein homolog R1B-16 n=1 Tax=Bidens hawaiensis TaxID=980011 RepID=UPI00404AA348
MGRRYFVVIDDIWDIEAWADLKLFFPHDNNGSRILLTTRLTEVAKHANSDGLIHHLGYLSKETSWKLLCEKVFQGNECPQWSIKPGIQIVENCKGVPLVIVVIAGVLAKNAWSRNLWMEIADKTGLYIVGEDNGCMETLVLSYNHLPLHLRECFLYLGGFPEDYQIQVKRLIWLWEAEGFIQEDGNKSLEDIAEGYLVDLIDRNLVIVDSRKSNGGVKACKVHDLVMELCLKKAREERFILQTTGSSNIITTPYKLVRKFISAYDPDLIPPSTQNLQSILCLRHLSFISYDFAKYMHPFVLLRVLDLLKCEVMHFPYNMELLVHLRYLAIWYSCGDFPSSICKLWNLQTLFYYTDSDRVLLPSNISDLVNLRHLSSNLFLSLPSIVKPMNLQTITGVVTNTTLIFRKYFPYVTKLKCQIESDEPNDFKSFTSLEKLCLWGSGHVKNHINIVYPATLKRLTKILWSNME